MSVTDGDLGDDLIDGGAGSDWVTFTNGPVSVDLASGIASGEGHDTLRGLENAHGSNDSDRLVGDDLGNILVGGPAADSLTGRAGDDDLDGEKGADTNDGGDGTDKCRSPATGQGAVNCEL